MNEANTLEEITGQAPFPADPQRTRISPPTQSAFDLLKMSIRLDPAYAWSWHCNVVMPILDTRRDGQSELVSHRTANEMGANVMRHLFDVDVRASEEWRVTFAERHENGDGR